MHAGVTLQYRRNSCLTGTGPSPPRSSYLASWCGREEFSLGTCSCEEDSWGLAGVFCVRRMRSLASISSLIVPLPIRSGTFSPHTSVIPHGLQVTLWDWLSTRIKFMAIIDPYPSSSYVNSGWKETGLFFRDENSLYSSPIQLL